MDCVFPANTVMLTSGVNATAGNIIYEDESRLEDSLYCDKREDGSILMDKARFYKMLVTEYGRCVGKAYVGDGIHSGWVFVKKAQYSDCKETYLQETWITFASVTPKAYNHQPIQAL
jgi:hypothetical protein